MPLSEINALYLKPCTCALCPDCFGTGEASLDASGRITRNIKEAIDVEVCRECYESGVIRVCSRCRQINALLKQETMLEAA